MLSFDSAAQHVDEPVVVAVTFKQRQFLCGSIEQMEDDSFCRLALASRHVRVDATPMPVTSRSVPFK